MAEPVLNCSRACSAINAAHFRRSPERDIGSPPPSISARAIGRRPGCTAAATASPPPPRFLCANALITLTSSLTHLPLCEGSRFRSGSVVRFGSEPDLLRTSDDVRFAPKPDTVRSHRDVCSVPKAVFNHFVSTCEQCRYIVSLQCCSSPTSLIAYSAKGA